MVSGREQERKPGRFKTGHGLRLVQRKRHPETLKQVGTAGLARNGSIAVLNHTRPGGGGQQTRPGRQIQAAGPIAARAHGIDCGRAVRNNGMHGQLTHGSRETANLGSGFSLGSKAGEQCTG